MFSYVGRRWYGAASLVLVGCFVALASIWVHLVPYFESPDEPAHFDYAYALASAGRLLLAADAPTGYDPRVAVLMNHAGLGMAFHPDQRVPPEYGTPAFEKTIRVEADAQASYSPFGPHAVRPALVSVYPFVPYALYAFAIAPVRGDIIASLMAARYASVFFSAIGLFAWSRILLRLHLGKAHALALVAIAAFFPLTTFVGSYVQPDGVAFAIVALLLWTTLRIRDGRANLPHGIAYAIVLAALAGTKLQFFVAAGAATIVTVAFAYARSKKTTRALVACVVVAASSAVIATSQWAEASATDASYFHGKVTLTTKLSSEIAHRDLGGIIDGIRTALVDLFFGGTSFASFWGVFGWLDTAIQIRSYRVTGDAYLVEKYGTLLAVVVLVIALFAVLRRLWRVGTARSIFAAVRVATNDPVLNGYVVFAGLLVALYVASGNLFGAQGRDWYGFEIAAFLAFTFYATRALTRRLRPFWTAAALTLLATYSVVGSASALTTIEDRYYRPIPAPVYPDVAVLPLVPGEGSVTVDRVRIFGRALPEKPTPILRLTSGDTVEIEGWAYDPITRRPCEGLYDSVDGHFVHWISYGSDRTDVEAVFANFDMLRTGFYDALPIGKVRPGPHAFEVDCVASDGSKSYVSALTFDAGAP